MADPYRFGGPIPESVQRLRKRREWRASSLYATVKRGRARDRAAATSVTSRAEQSPHPLAECPPAA